MRGMAARRRRWRWWLLGAAALFVGLQLLPFGRVENPPVTAEPVWDSPRTRALAARACFDCHSNRSTRQWYHVAPVSWLVAYDVAQAREHLNFSEWDREQEEDASDAAGEVEDGDMPLRRYLLVHPEARLSDAERAELARGLEATDRRGEPGEGREEAAEEAAEEEDDGGGRGRGRGRGRGGRGPG